MAYRRRQQQQGGYSYKSDAAPPPSSAASLATKAIRASAAYRDSSLSSAYEQSALSSPRDSSVSSSKDPSLSESTTKKNVNEPKQGFWGALARKAKAILDDDDDDNEAQPQEIQQQTASQTSEQAKKGQQHNRYNASESQRKTESSSFHRGLGSIASSLNQIGGTIGNALEEGLIKVENRTADIIQETRKIQIRKKSGNTMSPNQASNIGSFRRPPQCQTQTDMEMQLKASRDVSMAMAAKAKLLLRELKTVKADLAFAKERCGQLEEENKILRESREKGNNLEDDDLIRLQLETLLAEKGRLAQENSVYARENRFLREIVEYHQLTMQDVVYLNECSEEVTEVYPIKITSPSIGSPPSPPPIPTVPKGAVPQVTHDAFPSSVTYPELKENPYVQMPP